DRGGASRRSLLREEAVRQAGGRRLGSHAGPQQRAQRFLAFIDVRAGPAQVEVLQDLEVLGDRELAVHEQVQMALGFVALHRSLFSWKYPSCRAKSESSRRRTARARNRRLITVPIGTARAAEISL